MMLMRTGPAPSFDQIPDIREIALILWRRKIMIVAVTVVTCILGTGIVLSMPKIYRASSIIVLNDHDPDLNDFHDVTARGKLDDMSVQTEIRILRSPDLALQTIRSLNLNQDPEFSANAGNERALLASFSRNLGIDAQGASRAIEVSFKAHDPALAARIANAHIASYLEAQTRMKQEQTTRLSQWFEARVKDLKDDVTRKSRALEDYRAKENLAIGKDDKGLIYQQISDAASLLAPLQVQHYETQAKLESIDAASRSGRPDALSNVVASPLIQNLKAQAATTAQQVQSLSAQYGPNHPKLIAARSQLAEINQAITAETGNIKESLRNDARATGAQEVLLKTRLDNLKQEATGQRERTIALNSLQIERDASQKLLDSFLSNYENAQSQINFVRPDAVVVSRADIPAMPAPPGKKVMLLIVGFFAGCLALSAVFVAEMMQSGVRNFADLRKLSQKPLGILPKTSNPAIAMTDAGYSSYKEAIKRIYMSGIMSHEARIILVTSAMPGEGRTTFAVSMAHYLRSLGHSTLLIDADFMKPQAGRLLRLQNSPGLCDVLMERAVLDDAIGHDRAGFDILHSGSQALASPRTLRADALKKLFAELRQRYDYILVDSGPLLAHSEASLIAREVEGVIAVTEWLKTSQQNMENMFDILDDMQTPILGVVINKVDIGRYKNATNGSDFLLPRVANAA